MYPHHQATIQRVKTHFESQPGVEALLLTGSIAHGFAQASSDVDVVIIVSEAEYRQRFADSNFQFFSTDLAGYEGGYVDGKYVSRAFLDDVERSGSEPARFAFADSVILLSHIAGLEDQLQRITRYPSAEKEDRIRRFHAQFRAWHWYVEEAAKKDNPYLMNVATSKLILFGGRMILAHNELLYPYHKWFLQMVAKAERKPEQLVETMVSLARRPTVDGATTLYNLISYFREWELDVMPWPNRFMLDSELNWMTGPTPVDDL
jgi:predicted nucleotidyltransferase